MLPHWQGSDRCFEMVDAPQHRQIVCTSHAFLGGKLNLAHAAAVYLPASVDAGLGRLFGRPSLFATGIDLHGRQGERVLAGLSKADADALKESLVAKFPRDLAKLGISVDIYLRTDSLAVAYATDRAISQLKACGRLKNLPSVTLSCTGNCGDLSVSETLSETGETMGWKSHSRAAEVQDLRCALCGAKVERSVAQQYAVDLTGGDEVLAQVPELCTGKTGRKLLCAILRNDFGSWTISRSNYNGLPFPGDPDRTLYVWFPAIVSKGLLAERLCLSPEVFFGGQHAKFYFAKNIVQYYAKIMPLVLYHCFGAKQARYSYHIRGFCDVARSAQILDCDIAVARHGLSAVRFYCLYSVDDDARDFVLLPERIEAVEKGVMQGIFGRFLKKVELDYGAQAPGLDPQGLPPAAARLWARLARFHQQGRVRAILLALEASIQASCATTPETERLALYQITRALLEVYVPGWHRPNVTAVEQRP